jgi:predicted MFS family arabinose efflux permease
MVINRSAATTSAGNPFRHRIFTVLWVAAVVSNTGTWMYNAAAGWLMATLNADPLIVSLVQVATSLPMFLFALPAGALADIVDRRRLLILVQIALSVVAATIAALVWFSLITPALLLVFTFLLGIGAALTAPAWQAIVPQLVPRKDLSGAIVANGLGVNMSRAIGPALGGVIIAAVGTAAPFWVNAAGILVVVSALSWWRAPQSPTHGLAAERFVGAIAAGLRHVRHSPPLRATLMRAVGFFLFASAYWALLPLVARDQIAAGPTLYGTLLGAIGAGAVVGALGLPWLKNTLGLDRVVATGSAGTAVSLTLFGLAHEPVAGLAASVIAGISWIIVLSSLNVSAQASLPDWVRGRGLAVFVTVFFGAMTIGSMIWGQVGALFGLPVAHFCAAATALAAIPLTWRWKLQAADGIDLAPSMHWPAPIVTRDVDQDKGPVLVTIEYRIKLADRDAFLTALEGLAQERWRDGAYDWGVFEDVAEEGRMLEAFVVDSWLEHLRQHRRVTNADRLLQDQVHRFHLGDEPKVTHLFAAESTRLRRRVRG